MNATQEQWRPVVGYEGLYEVSEYGNVRSLDRTVRTSNSLRTYKGRVLKLHPDHRDYLRAVLSKPGQRPVTRRVHLLVLLAFVGPRPDRLMACHGDGNNRNNHFSNLRWDTCSANQHDRVRHGKHFNALKTHCPQGHLYDLENTYIRRGGGRNCRKCQVIAQNRFQRKQKASTCGLRECG